MSLSVPAVDPLSVAFATANSSAAAGTGCFADYDSTGGTLSFAPGETTKVVRVDLFDCDDVEGLQSFTLGLSAQVNATIVRATRTVSIVDNDIAPCLTSIAVTPDAPT